LCQGFSLALQTVFSSLFEQKNFENPMDMWHLIPAPVSLLHVFHEPCIFLFEDHIFGFAAAAWPHTTSRSQALNVMHTRTHILCTAQSVVK
jgi:hypothetical protein